MGRGTGRTEHWRFSRRIHAIVLVLRGSCEDRREEDWSGKPLRKLPPQAQDAESGTGRAEAGGRLEKRRCFRGSTAQASPHTSPGVPDLAPLPQPALLPTVSS